MKQLIDTLNKKPHTTSVSLEFLNIRDLTTMLPKLKQFQNLQTLSLHGNKLTSIPSLQILTKLKQLDISKNPIKIDNRLLDCLFTIPNLQILTIDIRTEEDRMLILQNLPKLKFLNNRTIHRIRQERPPRQEEMRVIKEKLAAEEPRIKAQLNNIYNLLDDTSAPPDISEEVSFNIKCTIEEFQYFYENINNELARNCVYLYYKNKVFQMVESHLTAYLEDRDLHNIASAIEDINKFKKQNFQQILKIILSFAYEDDFNKKTLEPQNKLRKQVLYQNEITRLKKQVTDLIEQNRQLKQNNERCIQKIYVNRKSKTRSVTPKQKNRQQNGTPHSRSTSNNILTPMNRSTLKTPMNRSQSKRQFHRTPSKSTIREQNYPTPQNRQMSRNKVQKKTYEELDKVPSYDIFPLRKDTEENLRNFQKSNSLASFPAKKLNTNYSAKSINRNSLQHDQQFRRTPSKQHIQENKQNKLTLDQMVQFIDEFIYEKGKFNIQCRSKGQLFQTPQQFLYTYFLRKYGLKDMALEWSLIVIKAIETFSKQNVIVEVFGKILKNTVQEQFYAVCKEFKIYLNSSIPLIQNFTQEDVRQIFFAVFPEEHSEQYQKFILKADSQIIKGQKLYPRRPLLQKLQKFYVNTHDKKISKYLNHFKAHDKDDDGIIQNDEIQKCISTYIKKYADFLNIYRCEENIQKIKEEILAKRRRKGNLVSMTFSQFVSSMRDYF